MTFDDLIELFELESYPNQWGYQEGEPEFVPVAGLVDCNTAAGECYDVSTFFVEWIAERGYEAIVVETENVNEWDMRGTNRYGAPSDNANHAAAVVTVGRHQFFVDWTAAQFGESAFPLVRSWNS